MKKATKFLLIALIAALLLGTLDTGDGEFFAGNGIHHGLDLCFIFQFFLLAPAMVMGSKVARLTDPA